MKCLYKYYFRIKSKRRILIIIVFLILLSVAVFSPFSKLLPIYAKFDVEDIFDNDDGIEKFRGKTIAIIGDSIATWEGKNTPEIEISSSDVGVTLSTYITEIDILNKLTVGNRQFKVSDIGKEIKFTPNASDIGKSVGSAKTKYGSASRPWWYWLCKKLKMNCNNASYSGSSLSSHESHKKQNEYFGYAWHESTLRKCGTRIKGSMKRIPPDYIIIARGCNDYSHTPYSVISNNTYQNINSENISNDKTAFGAGFKEALFLTVRNIKKMYPKSKIFLSTITPTNRFGNECNLIVFNNAILDAGKYFDIPIIDFNSEIGVIGIGNDGTHPDRQVQYRMYKVALKAFCN